MCACVFVRARRCVRLRVSVHARARKTVGIRAMCLTPILGGAVASHVVLLLPLFPVGTRKGRYPRRGGSEEDSTPIEMQRVGQKKHMRIDAHTHPHKTPLNEFRRQVKTPSISKARGKAQTSARSCFINQTFESLVAC